MWSWVYSKYLGSLGLLRYPSRTVLRSPEISKCQPTEPWLSSDCRLWSQATEMILGLVLHKVSTDSLNPSIVWSASQHYVVLWLCFVLMCTWTPNCKLTFPLPTNKSLLSPDCITRMPQLKWFKLHWFDCTSKSLMSLSFMYVDFVFPNKQNFLDFPVHIVWSWAYNLPLIVAYWTTACF